MIKLNLYGGGLVGEDNFGTLREVEARLTEVLYTRPEWLHYEIEVGGEVVEEGSLTNFFTGKRIREITYAKRADTM